MPISLASSTPKQARKLSFKSRLPDDLNRLRQSLAEPATERRQPVSACEKNLSESSPLDPIHRRNHSAINAM